MTDKPALDTSQPNAPSHGPGLISLAIDLGPLLVFFAAFWLYGIYWATGALMAATLVAIVASRVLTGRISTSHIITAVFVGVFGALTFWFQDPSFIKMKPTIIYLLFSVLLGGGLALKKPTLELVLGQAVKLDSLGWQILTRRWIGFFLVMAVVNEIVWRNFSDGAWATFKTFGILPLTLVFVAFQLSLIQKHQQSS